MKVLRTLACLSTFALAAPALQAEGGPYFTLDGGALFTDFDFGVGGIDADTGFGINAAIGHTFADYAMSLELNGGYYSADYGGSLSGVSIGGDVELVPIMANAKFDLPLAGPVSLELGAGVGIVYATIDATASAFGRTLSASDDDWSFGFQGLGGLNVDVAENVSLKAGYRFFYADGGDILGHYVGGGVTVRF